MLKSRVKIIFTIWINLLVAQSQANDSWIKDTIFVDLDETYGKYINHRVEKKQTLFSLANAYVIDLFDVYDYNPILKSRILFAGDNIRIPLSNDHIIVDEQQLNPAKKNRPVYYFVKPKDNLYRIAKVYFNMAFEDLMTRNNLHSQSVKVGQKLLIGWFDPEKKSDGTPDYKPNLAKNEQTKLEQKWTDANPSGFTIEYKALDLVAPEWKKKYGQKENNSDKIIDLKPNISTIPWHERKTEPKVESTGDVAAAPKVRSESNSILNNPNVTNKSDSKTKVLKRRMITQNGIAQWAKTVYQTNELYVLHPSAPINSVVELTNPMTHRKIYAKVLSNMPAKLYPDDISVVVSPGVANLLGAIDSRFYIKLRFIEETIQ